MKKDIIALGHAITDIIVKITDDELKRVGIEKGGFSTKNREEVRKLVEGKDQTLVVGGSPTNVAFNTNYLALNTAFIGCVARDTCGKNFINKLVDEGIETIMGNLMDGKSGICYVLVTPDGERSFSPDLGVSPNYNIDFQRIPDAKVFHTSGYELKGNPEFIKKIMNHAKGRGMLTSFDMADSNIDGRQRENLEHIISLTDILFMTEEEAFAYSGKDPMEALHDLKSIIQMVILKKGINGSVVRHFDKTYDVQVYKPQPRLKNTNGAGDAYTAGFLWGIVNNRKPAECGSNGSYIASLVCSKEAPHCSKAIKSTIIYHNQPGNQR